MLESRGEASRSAESAVVAGAEFAARRLDTPRAVAGNARAADAASRPRRPNSNATKGTSCPNSKPGDGPRRKMREEDAQRFSFASEFVKGRVGAGQGRHGRRSNGDLAKIVSSDASTFDAKTGTRNEFMRALGRKLDLTVTGFNAFRTDPQLRQIRIRSRRSRRAHDLRRSARARASPAPTRSCRWRCAASSAPSTSLPELEKPEIAAVEGSEATIEAFRRLTTTFYGLLSFKLPPSADELRELQKKAVQSVENPPDAEVRTSRAFDDGEAAGLVEARLRPARRRGVRRPVPVARLDGAASGWPSRRPGAEDESRRARPRYRNPVALQRHPPRPADPRELRDCSATSCST